jgi:NIPSNAP
LPIAGEFSRARERDITMIHELRIYRTLPGRLPNLLARFQNHTLRIWEKHGIRQAGFWTTLIGESNNELTYLIAWESLAERETKWSAFMADPEWIAARSESEKDGAIVATLSSQILAPTAFSAVK